MRVELVDGSQLGRVQDAPDAAEIGEYIHGLLFETRVCRDIYISARESPKTGRERGRERDKQGNVNTIKLSHRASCKESE